MSQRSYRRLAVVAGAALAVGSMAPALAVQVGVDGDATADVTVPAVTAPSVGSLVPTEALLGFAGTAVGTMETVQGQVITDVYGLGGDVSDIVFDLLAATPDLTLDVDANANASGGSAGASVVVSGGFGPTTGVFDAVPRPGELVGMATPLVGTVRDLRGSAVDLARAAGGLGRDTAGGLLGTGFGLLDGISASGEINVIANVMGSL